VLEQVVNSRQIRKRSLGQGIGWLPLKKCLIRNRHVWLAINFWLLPKFWRSRVSTIKMHQVYIMRAN
jgi:hypothetical protein